MLRLRNARVLMCVFALIALAQSGIAQSTDYLKAPVLRGGRLLLSTTGTPPTLQWQVDDNGKAQDLEKDATFLAPANLSLEFHAFNPLTTSVNISQKDLDEPAIDAITKLVEAMGGVVLGVRGPLYQATPRELLPLPCNVSVQDGLEQARQQLKTLGKVYDQWVKQIDGAKDWPKEIKAVQDEIVRSANTLSNCRGELDDSLQKSEGDSGGTYKAVDARIDTKAVLSQLDAVVALLQKLDQILNPFLDGKNWDGSNFKLDTISPKFWKEKQVTVSVIHFGLKQLPGDNQPYFIEQDLPQTATFTIERHWLLYPSAGAGMVFGSVSHPKYIAALNGNGQMAVTFYKNVTDKVSGAVTLNLVAHASIKHNIAPFVQLGAASSGSPLALLFGGGARLFSVGKGDIGLGGGLMLAWYKDLDKLKAGDAVPAQQAIDDDLAIKGPKPRPYFSIQYKF